MPVKQLGVEGPAPRVVGGVTEKLPVRGLVIGFVAIAVATSAGLLIGPADIDRTNVLKELLDRLPFISVESGLTSIQKNIIWEVRLPR
ncbi:MAG TPA: hypothetical protein DCX77_05510, partial [Acidimicrobiaceae bacterium]|nr:hypothetical protein [Acidimicrobiaceae bacterium]